VKKEFIYKFVKNTIINNYGKTIIIYLFISSFSSFPSYILVADHDLAVLDYISDYINVFYGRSDCYGVVSFSVGVRQGLNMFLAGHIPSENACFRHLELSWKVSGGVGRLIRCCCYFFVYSCFCCFLIFIVISCFFAVIFVVIRSSYIYIFMFQVPDDSDDDGNKNIFTQQYPEMHKTLGTFELICENGSFSEGEIIVLVGENGTGKTTFLNMLSGLIAPDGGVEIPHVNVSYKPQKLTLRFGLTEPHRTVRELLHFSIKSVLNDSQFISDILEPLSMESLMEKEVQLLSGGELQRVALTVCLGKPASVYFIDEPTTYLDVDQRVLVSKVIKRCVLMSMCILLCDYSLLFQIHKQFKENSICCGARFHRGIVPSGSHHSV
jgi:ATP-binding cassette subfamily E protein 1